jgi:uncharacterized membrane protein
VQQRERLAWLDAARGVAVIAMVVYHATWNLAHFGFLPIGTMQGGLGIWSARLIASSFLLLAGIGLALAHAKGFRPAAFWRRFLIIAASAALITGVSLVAMPGLPILFGILHCIALASLLALPFLNRPLWIAAVVGLVLLLLALLPWRLPAEPLLLWVGLMPAPFAMGDYAPLVPFAGVLLLGVAMGRIVASRMQGAVSSPAPAGSALRWLGRHSLAIYLIHQPLLFGATMGAAAAFPPVRISAFVMECEKSCQAKGADPALCAARCQCLAVKLEAQSLPSTEAMQQAIDACLSERDDQ